MKLNFRNIQKRYLILAIVAVVILIAGGTSGGAYYYYKHYLHKDTEATKDVHLAFIDEVWDTVKTNYWDKEPDDQLANLYKLGAEKILEKPQTLATADKAGVEGMVNLIMKDMAADKKKEFVTNLSDIVLANLKPFGRSRLYSQKQEQTLRDTVQNKDPNASDPTQNLYAALGTTKDATQAEIVQSYQEKVKAVDPKTAEGQQKLAQLERAKAALANPDNRKVYDSSGVEPTVITKKIDSRTFYMHITKVSPQTFDEFQKAANSTETSPGLNSLIVDLRGNIGGAIDILPYFLGPFIGPDSYAYDFFHQGDYTPYKTKLGWMPSLVKFKKVVILIDGESQSSAEVMAATFKKYNVGVVVGSHTKGWGTIEQIMPMKTQLSPDEKYSMLMVHSITLRDDGEPIEGRGVDPTINIADKNWDKQLLDYYNLPSLVAAVKEALILK